jgi:hypothetical protein
MNVRKFCLIIFIITSLLISITGFIFAESYTSYVDFHSDYSGTSRQYSGNSLSIYMHDVELLASSPSVDYRYFTVECWKDGFLFFDTKLSGQIDGIAYRDGSGYVIIGAGKTWTMIGNGKYFFRFYNNYVYGSEHIYSPIVNMYSN